MSTLMNEYLRGDNSAYFSEEEWNETPRQREERKAKQKAAVDVPKGTCPKCLQHIGRGIAFHVKRCEGAE